MLTKNNSDKSAPNEFQVPGMNDKFKNVDFNSMVNMLEQTNKLTKMHMISTIASSEQAYKEATSCIKDVIAPHLKKAGKDFDALISFYAKKGVDPESLAAMFAPEQPDADAELIQKLVSAAFEMKATLQYEYAKAMYRQYERLSAEIAGEDKPVEEKPE